MLLKGVFIRGDGIVSNLSIVFFNYFEKEVEVKYIVIWDLKKVRNWFGNDVVDFVFLWLYMVYLGES